MIKETAQERAVSRMKIIKQGKSKADVERMIKATKRFECELCGCIFEANKGEYKSYECEYNEIDYYCICPNCETKANEVIMREPLKR